MMSWTCSSLVQLMARHQAITWTIADLLSIETLGTNFSEILIELQTFFHRWKRIWGFRLQTTTILSPPQIVLRDTRLTLQSAQQLIMFPGQKYPRNGKVSSIYIIPFTLPIIRLPLLALCEGGRWNHIWCIESWTKMAAHVRRHLWTHFLRWNYQQSDTNFINVSPLGWHWQWVNICFGNGWSPHRR